MKSTLVALTILLVALAALPVRADIPIIDPNTHRPVPRKPNTRPAPDFGVEAKPAPEEKPAPEAKPNPKADQGGTKKTKKAQKK